MLTFPGTGVQGFSQDGLRDTQRGDRSFSTFPGRLHVPRDPSRFYLLPEPAPPPPTSTQGEQGGDPQIVVWISEQMSWSVWASFGLSTWQH